MVITPARPLCYQHLIGLLGLHSLFLNTVEDGGSALAWPLGFLSNTYGPGQLKPQARLVKGVAIEISFK